MSGGPRIVTQNPSEHLAPGQFPTTHWSRVLAAADRDAPGADASLADLCNSYWYPVYAYIRRRGHSPEQAEDLTQDFFALMLERKLFEKANPERGRFRAFLRTICARYLANQHDWESARKRGGGRRFISMDALEAEGRYVREVAEQTTPERIFERTWTLTLLARVLEKLRREYEDAGRSAIFNELRGALVEGSTSTSYAEIAARLGSNEGTVRVSAHRLRRRYGALLRDEIAATIEDPAEVDAEIRALFMALEA